MDICNVGPIGLGGFCSYLITKSIKVRITAGADIDVHKIEAFKKKQGLKRLTLIL